MWGYLIAGLAGYGIARAVDNPERVRAAADAAKGEYHRIRSAAKTVSAKKEGSAAGRSTNVSRFVDKVKKDHKLARYVVLEFKEFKGSPGPTFKFLGSASTLPAAQRLAETQSKHVAFVVFDNKTKASWKEWVPRQYKMMR